MNFLILIGILFCAPWFWTTDCKYSCFKTILQYDPDDHIIIEDNILFLVLFQSNYKLKIFIKKISIRILE